VIVAAGAWHDDTPGGAYRLATDFARYLAAREYRVHYVCPSGSVATVERTRTDRVDVWRYPAPNSPSPSLGNVRAHLACAREVANRVAANERVTALLGHSQLQFLGASAGLGRSARRTFGVHSPFALELREQAGRSPTIRQRLSWRAAGWMERHIIDTADLIHCDSAFTGRLIVDRYGEGIAHKTAVLPGWVDCAAFAPARAPRAALRADFGHPWCAGVPTFLSLRRLVPRMGIDLLIDAAASLAQRGREFRVIVAGEGPLRGDLESRSAALGLDRYVAFIGRVPQSRLADLYSAADCFVLPTRALECFGLIVLESYACGTPVIGVPVGAIPEVMGAAFSDWIAADNTAPAIAARMASVLDRTLFADPARLRARASEFDSRAVMPRHEDALLGACADVRDEVA
jgi:glycosyltransferase involved in cell wall biosynthesis